jgi:hypothetical protein
MWIGNVDGCKLGTWMDVDWERGWMWIGNVDGCGWVYWQRTFICLFVHLVKNENINIFMGL